MFARRTRVGGEYTYALTTIRCTRVHSVSSILRAKLTLPTNVRGGPCAPNIAAPAGQPASAEFHRLSGESSARMIGKHALCRRPNG
jgi:hypothetical protein